MDDQALIGVKAGQKSDERLQLCNAQAAKRRLKYRQKLKQGRKALQQQKLDLSAKLSSLLQKRKVEMRNQTKNPSLAVWKAIAIREKEKRIMAEQKRRQLREAVILQTSIFDQIKVQLQQHLIEYTSPFWTDASEGESQGFVGELNDRFAQTDQVVLEDGVNVRI
ncbi:hypothetical protein DVH05_007436 [Phytophthora capsici]|nr:hypothetical protein DVH05_007436 [Phytophthora capsici]